MGHPVDLQRNKNSTSGNLVVPNLRKQGDSAEVGMCSTDVFAPTNMGTLPTEFPF